MSQLGIYKSGGVAYNTGILLSNFATITLTTAVAQNFTIGELITGGTSGATARVSGVVQGTGTANTVLRVKAVKANPVNGNVFAAAETITGARSLATGVIAASGFTVQQDLKRQDSTNQGTPTLFQYDTMVPDDGGLNAYHRTTGATTRPYKGYETLYAARMMKSKGQANDAGAFTWGSWNYTPAAGTYSAGGGFTLQWTINTTEAVSVNVTGVPRLYILDNVTNQHTNTWYAYYVSSLSSDQQLVFRLIVPAGTLTGAGAGRLATGALVSATYDANGGSINDVSAPGGVGATLTPVSPPSPTVTSIVIAA